MINPEVSILLATAVTIGTVHTLFGPDHYLPFIVMSKARNWTRRKTVSITLLCGLGHVLSSVLLGFIGILLGIGVARLELVEGFRGNIAAWLFIIFGFTYFVWGLNRSLKKKKHSHSHFHLNGTIHSHEHNHSSEHAHVHETQKKNLTPWILFLIFVLGPCEPLIPLLMYPAAQSSISATVLVAGVFTASTLLTMTTIVILATYGINLIKSNTLERYMHPVAGATIMLSGIGIVFLGL